jgi:hypothetical protein
MRLRLASAAIAVVTLIAAAVTTLAAGGSPARAEENEDSFASRLFAGNLGRQAKSYVCFVRAYDAAHLKQHRLQKVSAMTLLVTAEKVPEDEALNYSFRLDVMFRHRPGDFDSSGDCGHIKVSESEQGKTQLGCSVDCDGGGITVELARHDKSTLVRLDSIRIWRNNRPDEDGFPLSGGADDRLFRLDRASLDRCRSLVTDRQELAAMRRK